MQLLNEIRFDNLRGDLFGGVTAAVIALPMALAFGVASGAGPAAGLYGAVLVGLFAALFGGTPTLISEPTGPMTVVMTAVIANLVAANPENGMAMAFTVVMLAGVFQMLFGALKLGHYVTMMPYTVVSGFMSGIGCIIIALQAARLFGHEPEGGGTVPALMEIPGAVMDPNFSALVLGVVTLLIVFKWPKNWGRILPGPLAALIAGTLISLALPAAPILGDIPTGLPSFIMPVFSTGTALIVLEAALILALLGAIDSLLTSLVADNMTRTRHDSNRELVVQGIGNMFAGFFGGIPGANPNPTGAVAISELTDKPVINLSGCPPIPEAMTGTITYLLSFAGIPELDHLGRPQAFFGEAIHAQWSAAHADLEETLRRFAPQLAKISSSLFRGYLRSAASEARDCEPGHLESWRFPHLKSVICIGDEQHP